jgi:phenylalanyl-tRNA synthetase beta chain
LKGDHSKITLNTKNVFIECTATDLRKAEIALDTIVTMFSEYCNPKFEVERVEVVQVDGTVNVYPKLHTRQEVINVQETNRRVGINIDSDRMQTLLNKMGLNATKKSDSELLIDIPPTRSDILHACDIVEDVAIAYGFNSIQKTIPKTNCFSEEV